MVMRILNSISSWNIVPEVLPILSSKAMLKLSMRVLFLTPVNAFKGIITFFHEGVMPSCRYSSMSTSDLRRAIKRASSGIQVSRIVPAIGAQ